MTGFARSHIGDSLETPRQRALVCLNAQAVHTAWGQSTATTHRHRITQIRTEQPSFGPNKGRPGADMPKRSRIRTLLGVLALCLGLLLTASGALTYATLSASDIACAHRPGPPGAIVSESILPEGKLNLFPYGISCAYPTGTDSPPTVVGPGMTPTLTVYGGAIMAGVGAYVLLRRGRRRVDP